MPSAAQYEYSEEKTSKQGNTYALPTASESKYSAALDGRTSNSQSYARAEGGAKGNDVYSAATSEEYVTTPQLAMLTLTLTNEECGCTPIRRQ